MWLIIYNIFYPNIRIDMKWIFIIAVLCLFSCRSVKYVPVETVKTEKEYIDRLRRDSMYVHDSIFIFMKGDTLFRDRWHTVYKDKYFRDTVFFGQRDSIQMPFPVEKPLSKWQNVKLQAGGFALSAIVIFVLVVVVRMVRKLRR